MSQDKEIGPNIFMLDPDAKEAKEIAAALTWYSPKFSPKNVPRFYDISSLTEDPHLFKMIIDVMAAHYNAMDKDTRPTHIVGFDARGFIMGAPLAVALGVPFVLLRKAEKSPGLLMKSNPYAKEYAEKAPDTMVLRLGSIKAGDRVVLVDDLIATGGTAVSGFELVHAIGAKVLEFAALIAIPACQGVERIRSYADGIFKDVRIYTLLHDNQISEDNCADPKNHTSESRIVTVGKL